ncbi:NPCBM/NEW2 domain-containing protein [Halosquirtibacter laminarini]|uniref:NPCBM/NEW2 domain-containing protein n=1 Tax=Halosquirtibacter laminarini TaxID=3374600 RepID=A0AC61NEH9_9BACT|nr:NPCBM/NEW2 domain-containing protein [Prolixibacteraceae bacterium]
MNNLLFQLILLVGLCSTVTAQGQQKIKLGSLSLGKIEQPYLTATKDIAVDGKAIVINGEKYTTGIGTLPGSILRIKLDGNSTLLEGRVGVKNSIEYKGPVKHETLSDGLKMFYYNGNDSKYLVAFAETLDRIQKGTCRFQIVGDGKVLWKSNVLSTTDNSIPFRISIDGIKELVLTVDDGGDGISGDLPCWIDPVITTGSKVTLVDHFKVQSNTIAKNNTLQNKVQSLPTLPTNYKYAPKKDWLIQNENIPSGVFIDNNGHISLSNGLITRTFSVTPNCATIGLYSNVEQKELLRSMSPEAEVSINGEVYAIGGLEGETDRAYFQLDWLKSMRSMPNAFTVQDFRISPLQKRVDWKNKRWSLVSKDQVKGKTLTFIYGHKDYPGVAIEVNYAIYDNVPLIEKWIAIENNSENNIIVDSFKSEIIALFEEESSVERGKSDRWNYPNIHIESDYAFHAMSFASSNKVVNWVTDKKYTSQANYNLNTPCVLECKPPIGPSVSLNRNSKFSSFRVWFMPYDSYDKQRKGLEQNRFYMTVAPWTTENPIFLHLVSSKPKDIKNAIDQASEVGYEMVILSFGSGLNMENSDPKYLKKYKKLADYAHSKGIELGGYSLLSSRWISDDVDVINPKTGKRGGMIHGSSPCLGTEWADNYFKKLRTFFTETGFDLLEHDGSYPGQVCASNNHKHHKDVHDSQWYAWSKITDFYKWCNSNDISMNIPDWYYLSGSNKNGIGYREVNWSLPRERQLVIGRQNNYDGTWKRLPSMSWTFVPLTQYHGGGAAATIEPLSEHLQTYKAHMMQNYGSGVQACYRGKRLYDTDKTKEVVKDVIGWYKENRKILNSPIVHIRRPDGRNIDGFIHVNPSLKNCGLAMFFNPTNTSITEEIKIPLYYTGKASKVKIIDSNGKSYKMKLDRDYNVKLNVTIAPSSYVWYRFE